MNESDIKETDEMKPVASSPDAEQERSDKASMAKTSASTSGVYGKALAMVGITTGYIFGPIILFGGVGYFINQAVNNRVPLFISLVLAFAVSNWLIFKHTPKVMSKLSLSGVSNDTSND